MDESGEFPIKRSFIEETFPVKEVSEQSAREKNIRHGHNTARLTGKTSISSFSWLQLMCC